jgi:prepilin-type N-terminal cleavage/methylation domain-containing protein/prepilin-type processing-associated H-X9-DG protein
MKRRGFTLVELLVVIVIIALLMAILVPLLQNSREHTKATLCGSNIRQLVLGLAMYETENETFPHAFNDTPMEPPPGGYAGYFQYDRIGWRWFNHIIDYSRKDSNKNSVIWCPSRRINNRRLKNNVLCGNYGVNQSVCKSSRGRRSHAEFSGTPLGSTDITYPAQTLLIVDSGYSMITWWHATDAPPVPLGNTIIEDAAYIPGLRINRDRDLWPGQEEDAINDRHSQKTVNVGFVDGHVSRKKANDLFVEKTADSYKNLNPLWRPE